jgi:hypothetical protein
MPIGIGACVASEVLHGILSLIYKMQNGTMDHGFPILHMTFGWGSEAVVEVGGKDDVEV